MRVGVRRTRVLLGAAAALVLIAVPGVLVWWRGPEWNLVRNAFELVSWHWVAAALGLNLLSVFARALAWRTVVDQAVLPGPPFGRIFSAYSVGLLGNAALPGRVGELARVAVLARRMERGRGVTATLLGTVFAHRVFDLFPALVLIAYVLLTAEIPHWAVTSLVVAAGLGIVLFAFALVGGRIRQHPALHELGRARRLLSTARQGLGVMKSPLAAVIAVWFQSLGWFLQLIAVWATMRAFEIDAPLDAAALVLLLMNVATVFPLWPGNIGLLQAAVALPLVSYGVAYARGFAYGLGLQMIEVAVGVGLGLVFLAREGLSFATLKQMPETGEAELAEAHESVETFEADAARSRARVSR
jgi:glycosyltransferase 2 family protein